MTPVLLIYLLATLLPITAGYEMFDMNDPHNVLRRELFRGQLADLSITVYTQPGCQGQATPVNDVKNHYAIDFTPRGIKSYNLNRTLTGPEQLDFSKHTPQPPPAKAGKTKTPPPAPLSSPGHVDPTTAAVESTCHYDGLLASESSAGIAVPPCKRSPHEQKRQSLPGCALFVWTADAPRKVGNKCHNLPKGHEAFCWNLWFHG